MYRSTTNKYNKYMIQIVSYLIMLMTLVSAVSTISLRNPIYSIIFLKLTFLCGASLMVILEAEYIAMTVIIVYVGAVVILFLFVIMMIDVEKEKLTQPLDKISLYVILTSIIFFGLIIYALHRSRFNIEVVSLLSDNEVDLFKNSVKYIGTKLYTKFALEFQITGILLFLAMIGSITLIHQKSSRLVRKQNIAHQVMTDKRKSIKLVSVKYKSGVNI